MWDSLYMRVVILCLCITFFINECIKGSEEKNNLSDLLKVYEVNKKVSDFPQEDDFSTPEATYAVVNRVIASGKKSKWRKISVSSLANRLSASDTENKEVDPNNAKVWRNAKILEVRIFKQTTAVVFAELKWNDITPKIDKRYLELENGRWLNRGQDAASANLEEARAEANAKFAYQLKNPSRPAIDNPEAYLKPFVEFLNNNAQEPEEFVKNALSTHKVTIIGEIHHRPRYWAFNSSLVTESDFSKNIGTIYLELPSNDQYLVDKFLANDKCDTMSVIEMLRDMLWMGWPDQAMLDFFVKVWMVNQNLEPQNRIRIVLVDMERPWSEIEKQQDWGKYDTNRDKYMAEKIIKDINKHASDKRNALFIAGVGHTALNFNYFEDAPVMTAGWFLSKELGQENVYAIMQHRCTQTNIGDRIGRLCLGLFDSAFAVFGNKQMAFTLDSGPFGEEFYDADPDRPVLSMFKDGFNAYLYLGPLETEMFSPLIAGFYTDEFFEELERRYQIMNNKKWSQTYRIEKANANSFINWMSDSWGKPRFSWQESLLGPVTAWHKGGNSWQEAEANEETQQALKEPENIQKTIQNFFDNLCKAPPIVGYYQTNRDWRAHRKWIEDTFTKNPIISIDLSDVFFDESNRPTVNYKLTLKDGSILEGVLPFSYDTMKKDWVGIEGIDWHLNDPFKK